MQSLSLPQFIKMKIETKQILVCINFNVLLTIFIKFSKNITKCYFWKTLHVFLFSIIEWNNWACKTFTEKNEKYCLSCFYYTNETLIKYEGKKGDKNTHCTTFHFKQSSLKFRGQICAKRYFREVIYKNNCQIRNQHPWMPLCTELHLKQSTLKFCDQICPIKTF